MQFDDRKVYKVWKRYVHGILSKDALRFDTLEQANRFVDGRRKRNGTHWVIKFGDETLRDTFREPRETYEVYDLGANEAIATFADPVDAEAFAYQRSINGPALQVRKA